MQIIIQCYIIVKANIAFQSTIYVIANNNVRYSSKTSDLTV